MMNNKSYLRKKYKEIRGFEKSLSKDKKICSHFINSIIGEENDTVFTYFSAGTEIATTDIISHLLSEGFDVALPKCTDSNGKMEFYIISDTEELVSGMYSIPEPDTVKCRKAIDSKNSVCIVPGLAFDNYGYRLGYGKGYYDRFLKDFKGKSVGLCYEACLCEQLPVDKYDISVDIIITENRIITLR